MIVYLKGWKKLLKESTIFNMREGLTVYAEYKNEGFDKKIMSVFHLNVDGHQLRLEGEEAARLGRILEGKETVFLSSHDNSFTPERVVYCSSVDFAHHLYTTIAE